MADENHDHDERPRPKFGELAPEGWVWHPPKDADRLDTARPAPEARETHPSTPTRPSERDLLAQAAGERPVPTWNQPVTILLLIVGIVGMFLSIGTIAAVPDSMQLMYANQGLGTYKPAPIVSTIMLAGEVAMLGIWVISSVISIFRLTRRKLAFFVPIIGGLAAFIALFVCLSAIVASDPTLIHFYGKLS